MRLFVAFDIDEAMRDRLLAFAAELSGFCPQLRWVRPESWHVTLKFLGEVPQSGLDQLTQALAEVPAESVELRFYGYGFFPTRESWHTFSIGVEANPKILRLAQAIEEALFRLKVPRSKHSFRPHLTLARRPRGSALEDGGGPVERLEEKLMSAPTPEFGTLSLREFCLYQSELSASGSHYSKLGHFALT
jgi:2'-5' RNA ligase